MKRRFTQAEVYYLNTLPAVERASMDRITYSRDFQVRCMAQYLRGNGPTSIFASAGLNPKIVGSKRIERAIARWKADPQIMLEAQSFANEAAADPTRPARHLPIHDHRMAGEESHGSAETDPIREAA